MTADQLQIDGMEDLATADQIAALVKLGFKEATVLAWPRWRASTTLKARQEEAARAYLQAPDKWTDEQPPPVRPPAAFELLDAAEMLDRAVENPATCSPHLALSYCVLLMDDESAAASCRALAGQFRARAK